MPKRKEDVLIINEKDLCEGHPEHIADIAMNHITNISSERFYRADQILLQLGSKMKVIKDRQRTHTTQRTILQKIRNWWFRGTE